jgi:hypothetical protein
MRKTPKLVLVLGLVAFVLLGLFTGCPAEVDEPKESVKAITITTNPEDVSALDNDATVLVTLATATDGADIYYTTDGKTPSKTEGTKFEEAFEVKTTNEDGEVITVKAIGIKEGLEDSKVAEKTITFKPVPEVELTLADLGEWAKDRTEPETWKTEGGWVTITTKEEPSNTWYAWQGRSAVTDADLSEYWEVETEIKLTEELLGRDGVRTSLWLAVEGEDDFRGANWAGVIDWSIIQFFIGPAAEGGATPDAVWQTWDSTYEVDGTKVGKFDDRSEGEIEAGTYTLKTIFDDGKITQFLNDEQLNTYDLDEDTSAPSAVIIQSYSYGGKYTVEWKVPVVKYLELEGEED